MIKQISYVFILLVFGGCGNSIDSKYIEGEWVFYIPPIEIDTNEIQLIVETEFYPSFKSVYSNRYTFYKNGGVEINKPLLSTVVDSLSHKKSRKYLGTKTKYKIERDSLKIYNVSDKIWFSKHITMLTEDRMILEHKGVLKEYSRDTNNIEKYLGFDKISLSTSGCYGTCPIINLILKENGEFLFHGSAFTEKLGYFKTVIPFNDFLDVKNRFRKLDLESLEDNYAAGHTDDESVTVTFYLGDKIVKSVEDYGRESPRDFFYAYSALRFLHELYDFKPMEIDEITPFSNLPNFSVKREKK